jgi:hypothetical protein
MKCLLIIWKFKVINNNLVVSVLILILEALKNLALQIQEKDDKKLWFSVGVIDLTKEYHI